MNDDPRLPELDDQLLDAVSAVVDGAADADERALVAASPEAQRWVDHLTDLRDEVASLTAITPPAHVRESALAAALAVFDELATPATVSSTAVSPEAAPEHAGATATVAAAVTGAGHQVVSLLERRRRRYRMVLGAAAAVAVLAVGGVVVRNAGRGSDDDAASTATEAVTGDAAAKAADEPLIASAETEAPAAAADAAEAATEAAPAGAAPAEDAAEMEPATSVAATIGAIPGPGLIEVASPGELAAYVVANVGAVGAGAGDTSTAGTEAPAATEAAAETTADVAESTIVCGGGDLELVGAISYQGHDAIAFVDPGAATAYAYDVATCDLLATALLD